MLHESLIKEEEEVNLLAKNLPCPPARTAGASSSKASDRLQSLDVMRGLTIALMILVDFCGDSSPSMDHSPWDGMCLADQVTDPSPTLHPLLHVGSCLTLVSNTCYHKHTQVVPFFDFMVGVSIAISMRGGRLHCSSTANQMYAGTCVVCDVWCDVWCDICTS